MDRKQWVTIPVDRFIRQQGKAVLVEVEGEEHFVGTSQIDNFDDIERHLARPTSEALRVESMEVPLWLAIENGWEDEEDWK